jgi:membrane protein DedA with SNARE-associated domain
MVIGGSVLAEQDGPVIAGMAVAAAGALVGDSFSFFLGATVGTRIVDEWSFLQRRFGSSIERAQRYFERRGGPLVFAARFVGALRAVVPFVAASSGMSYRRFLAWDAPAALIWGPLTVGLGAAFGDDIALTIDRLDWWVTVAIAAALAGWLLYRWVKHRRAKRALR